MLVRNPAFGTINEPRLLMLQRLKNRTLSPRELRFACGNGLKPGNTHYHLEILLQNQFIEKTQIEKPNVSKQGTRKIYAYKLTHKGEEAINYFKPE